MDENSEIPVTKIVAELNMREKKSELEMLVSNLFETGIVPDSKRNRLLVNIIIFCVSAILNFIKTDNVEISQ